MSAATREWIGYDDPESVRLKGEYIAAQNLAGAMFWELSDDEGSLLDALRVGLRASPTRCAIMNVRFPSVAIVSLATFWASSFFARAAPLAAMSLARHT